MQRGGANVITSKDVHGTGRLHSVFALRRSPYSFLWITKAPSFNMLHITSLAMEPVGLIVGLFLVSAVLREILHRRR